MLIYVRQTNGNGYSVEVDPNSSIFQLFQWINWENCQNSDDFFIYFRGSLIQATQKTFKDYQIKQNDILHLVRTNAKNDRQTHINISIFYNTETYSIRIKNKEQINKLKIDIFQLTHIHPREQFLVFNGKKLNDNLTLEQEHIQNDSLITLLKRKTQNYLATYKQDDPIENGLINSIASLKLHRKESQLTKQSKASLFRSDSLGIKTQQQYISPQVSVKNLNGLVDLVKFVDSETLLNRLFGFNPKNQLFGSCQHHEIQQKLIEYQLYKSCEQTFKQDFNKQINIKGDLNNNQCSSRSQSDYSSLYQKLKLDSNSLFQSLEFQHSQIKIKTQDLFCQKQNMRNLNPQFDFHT